MYFGGESEGLTSRMGAVQYLGLMVPALMMVVGAISMFGVDTAAGRAAETLVGPAVASQPAAAAEPAHVE